jgi:hypothetical protein
VSTEFRRHGIPRNFFTSEVISPELLRKSLPYSAECQNVTSVDTLGVPEEMCSIFHRTEEMGMVHAQESE